MFILAQLLFSALYTNTNRNTLEHKHILTHIHTYEHIHTKTHKLAKKQARKRTNAEADAEQCVTLKGGPQYSTKKEPIFWNQNKTKRVGLRIGSVLFTWDTLWFSNYSSFCANPSPHPPPDPPTNTQHPPPMHSPRMGVSKLIWGPQRAQEKSGKSPGKVREKARC